MGRPFQRVEALNGAALRVGTMFDTDLAADQEERRDGDHRNQQKDAAELTKRAVFHRAPKIAVGVDHAAGLGVGYGYVAAQARANLPPHHRR